MDRRATNKPYIVEAGSQVILRAGAANYSRFDRTSLYTRSYWDYFLTLPRLFKKSKALLIGLGGGTTVRQYHTLFQKRLQLDTVEIDPHIAKLAQQFLSKEQYAWQCLFIEEGAAFVQRCTNTYDLIILDAYIDDRIPELFLTKAFFSAAAAALKPRGLLAINYLITVESLEALDATIWQLKECFTVYGSRDHFIHQNMPLFAALGISLEELVLSAHRSPESTAHILHEYDALRQM